MNKSKFLTHKKQGKISNNILFIVDNEQMMISKCFWVIRAIKMDATFLILLEAIRWIVLIMETSKLPCPSFGSNFN